MTLSFPQAIIFDWDNTLVDSWGRIAQAANATRVNFGYPEWDMARIKENSNLSARESFPQWFGDRWQEAMDFFYARYSELQQQGLTPAQGSQELLRWLNEQNVPLCVVSNKNGKHLRHEAAALEWDIYFLSIVGAGDALRDKPAREHADHALTLAGLVPGPHIWFVGDSEADIVCGRNTGCTPVLIGTSDKARELKVNTYVPDCEALLGLLTKAQRAIE
jgi:phosphoglycolate phosphatase